MSEKLIVLCTCPDPESASQLAEALLKQRLAACINQVSGVTSLYRWEGQIQRDQEIQLLIKTTASAYPQLELLINEVHPYELPEILAVPVTMGSQAYLNWIEDNTG